jgi:hypothetical protein
MAILKRYLRQFISIGFISKSNKNITDKPIAKNK